MKNFGVVLFALILACVLGTPALSANLRCASKGKEDVYYGTIGQLLLKADVVGSTRLEHVEFSVKGSDFGSKDRQIDGIRSRNSQYIRFRMFGDHICEYKLTLGADFAGRRSFPAFLDSYCEENTNGSFRLNCRLD